MPKSSTLFSAYLEKFLNQFIRSTRKENFQMLLFLIVRKTCILLKWKFVNGYLSCQNKINQGLVVSLFVCFTRNYNCSYNLYSVNFSSLSVIITIYLFFYHLSIEKECKILILSRTVCLYLSAEMG